jgi:malonyl-CoA decarboxylase
MPEEPLVIIHVALTNHLSSNIVTLIKNLENESKIPNIEETATNAIFYSISSCQKGLKGVDLGNSIIKNCVNLLQEEVPTLKHFDTLSPIPGYRKWLNMKLGEVGGNEFLHLNKILSDAEIEQLYKLLGVEHGKYDKLKDTLREYLNSDEFKKISFSSMGKLDEAKRALAELANTL